MDKFFKIIFDELKDFRDKFKKLNFACDEISKMEFKKRDFYQEKEEKTKSNIIETDIEKYFNSLKNSGKIIKKSYIKDGLKITSYHDGCFIYTEKEKIKIDIEKCDQCKTKYGNCDCD